MNKYFSVIEGDFKNIRRDPTLSMLLFVPVIMLAVVRYLVPVVNNYIPGTERYYPVILAVFTLLTASFPGFIIAFIILDEKDQNLLPVIRITPVSISGFLLARLGYMSVLSLFSSCLLLLFNGLKEFTCWQILQLSVLSLLNAPVILLLMSAIAKNKIEGMTFIKAANVLLIIPVLIMFTNNVFVNILALLPAYWVYAYMVPGYNHYLIFFLGIVVLLLYNYLICRFAIRKL
jgi:hypothetical protein